MNLVNSKQLRMVLISFLTLCFWFATALAQKTKADASAVFAYDQAKALEVREESSKEQDGVTIKDISYAAYEMRRGRTKAYLVKPAGKGPFAGVLFFHWLGRPNGNRNQFLNEAVSLARQGVVSLLMQGYFPWLEEPKDGPTDRQQIINQTIEVRRALDVLLSQPEVDKKRVGYVGHDYGAMFGAIASGVEKRVKTYVFVAGMGNFGDWSLKYWPHTAKPGEAVYRQAVKDVDPLGYVSNVRPAASLFQFANSDVYISKSVAEEFFNAASNPKQVKWYDTEHEMNIEAARTDRNEWLTKQLKLKAAAK